MTDFRILSGEELFDLKRLVPPEPRECMQLRNNRAFIILAARIKARHHDATDETIRTNLKLVMTWMEEAATPPNEREKTSEKEDGKSDDDEDDLGES